MSTAGEEQYPVFHMAHLRTNVECLSVAPRRRVEGEYKYHSDHRQKGITTTITFIQSILA